MRSNHLGAVMLALAATLLGACATQERLVLPTPLPVPQNVQTATAQELAETAAPATRPVLRQSDTPRTGLPSGGAVNLDDGHLLPAMGSEPVSVNVENLRIAAFADVVFGKILGLNVSLEPGVTELQELVTLRTNEAQRPRQLFTLARQVLAEYGVSTSVEGDLVQLRISQSGSSAIPPLIVSGRALPQVPTSHRPVFQLVELEVVRSGDAVRWLGSLFGTELTVRDEPNRNAVLISGNPAQVNQALQALRVFDRPLMRGRVSTRLEPAFMTAEQLADRLVEILNVQGYGASRSLGSPASVLVVPVANVNSVLVFASSQQVMEYAVAWARDLDRPNPAAGAQSMFYYQVKNTKASELASVLSGSMQISTAGASAQSTQPAAGAEANPAPVRASPAGAASGLLVDEPRNALIYQGDPSQWERLLTLIRQMDRAPRQVMIEVTIAEVSLEDGEEFGVAWLFRNGFGRFDGTGTSGVFPGAGGDTGGSSGGSGLTYLLDVAGQNRFALTAFANDSRVNILSTPRLLVKSGSEANIDIGTEVPTISMTTTSNQTTDGNTNLLQSIQYRKTGIILRVKPTVYSDDRIDLDISQEVSEALPLAEDSTIGSPSIFNRSLNSSLTLRDGGSVVMAGLMSQRQTNASGGVPLLKDIPVLGNLFKSQRRTSNKTELVLMIIPYIIGSDERSQAVSQAVVDRLELLELPPAPVPSTPYPPLPPPVSLPDHDAPPALRQPLP